MNMCTDVNKFKSIIYKAPTRFKYRKVDGTERWAYGTINFEHMPRCQTFSNKPRNLSENIIRYFDLDKFAFRSFKKENFVCCEV